MSVRIRLRRMGAKKNPFYRIIVADSKKPRDGRYIDSIGTYDPLKEPSSIQIEEEKLFGWLKDGAQPSDPVWDLLSRLGLRQKWEMLRRGEDLSDWQPPAPRTPREKKAQVAEEKGAAEKVEVEEAAKPPAAPAEEKVEAKPAAAPEEEKVEAKAEEAPAGSKETAEKAKPEAAKEEKAAAGEKTAEPKAKGKEAAGEADKKEEVKAEKISKKEDVEKNNAENA